MGVAPSSRTLPVMSCEELATLADSNTMSEVATFIRKVQLDGATAAGMDDASLAELELEASHRDKFRQALQQLKQYYVENELKLEEEEAEEAEEIIDPAREEGTPASPHVAAAVFAAEEQREGLRMMYDAVNYSTELAALADTPTESMPGVDIYNVKGEVKGLNLSNQELSGALRGEQLATGAALLTNCTKLQLSHNALEGEIPEEIKQLANLQVLDLSKNSFSGSLPNGLFCLVKLTSLQLFGNCLEGPIGADIGNLVQLETLHLGSNQFTGSVPEQIGQLVELVELGLGNNKLTGQIPTTVSSLTNIKTVHLANNQLSGNLPVELGCLTGVSLLNLRGNLLQGSIPGSIGNLVNLASLDLGKNEFGGTLPKELTGLTKLQKLHLDANSFTLKKSKNPFEANLDNTLHGPLDCQDVVTIQRVLAKKPWEVGPVVIGLQVV